MLRRSALAPRVACVHSTLVSGKPIRRMLGVIKLRGGIRCHFAIQHVGDRTMGDRGILMTIVIGLLIGIVAKFLKPGKDPGGIIVTILIGIAGSFTATYLGQALGWYTVGQTAGFIASVVGAVILLILYGLVTRKR